MGCDLRPGPRRHQHRRPRRRHGKVQHVRSPHSIEPGGDRPRRGNRTPRLEVGVRRRHIPRAAFVLVSGYVTGLRERPRQNRELGPAFIPCPSRTALITRVVSRPAGADAAATRRALAGPSILRIPPFVQFFRFQFLRFRTSPAHSRCPRPRGL